MWAKICGSSFCRRNSRLAGALACALWLAAEERVAGQIDGASFPVQVYEADNPPLTPLVSDLPWLTTISQDGITWTFSEPERVGRFVNGDYYVVGEASIVDIQPSSTPQNGRNGSMLDIRPAIQRSGFDSRIESGRYDAGLRVYPPILLQPGHKLISSRSAGEVYLPAVMRPHDRSVSPVASLSILTSVASPQPQDAFRPSYAQGANEIYLSRNLRRQLLPQLPPVAHVPPLSEFEGYLRRPWVDSVFFSFDVPSEYMASYARENGYVMSFAGLLLTLDFSKQEKEALLIYLVQYGIDLFGLVERGHYGWPAQGGHGTGRKFPILLAGVLLNEAAMRSVQAAFGEDMQTIWVSETPPAGTYQGSWHTRPEKVVYGGHVGVQGEATRPGWGPYEHLQPAAWISTIGEDYRRCCTSVSWVGQALAARLIPEIQEAWNHQQFFSYVDRWMSVPDNPEDLRILSDSLGGTIDPDFQQGQSWKILSGGNYQAPHRTFVDEMWAAYRRPHLSVVGPATEGQVLVAVEDALPGQTNLIQVTSNLITSPWMTISTNVSDSERFLFFDTLADPKGPRYYRTRTLP